MSEEFDNKINEEETENKETGTQETEDRYAKLKDLVDDFMAKSKVLISQAGEKAGEYAKIAGDYAKTAGDTITKLYGDARARLEIEKANYAVGKKYRELGKLYYDAKAEGKTPEDETLIGEIRVLLEAIEALKKDEPISEEAEEIISKEEASEGTEE